ncbi:MAG: class I SAM-dependent methyltransferase [Actinomycetota bacterium]|nr:class I SAM-dependent methyltransferase [Actinomycetota bacterium]
MESLTFDRAVEFYDKTRGLPEEAMRKTLDMLIPRLRDHRCLEIGVGTGRFALPLSGAGIEMLGIDLSDAMLRKLIEQRSGERPLVALADATKLPFKDREFDAGLACHVFHLIPPWRDALAELFRTVAPGGTVLHNFGHFGDDEWREIMHRFLDLAGLPRRHRGANDAEEVDRVARELGAEVEVLEVVNATRPSSIARSIDALERGTFSITWGADDATRKRAAESVREWAVERFGDLAVEREVPVEDRWRSYRLSA